MEAGGAGQVMALIRYPGSKAKLAPQIVGRFPDEMRGALWAHQSAWEYREPFFGAGAVGFHVLKGLPSRSKVWLNDKDQGLVALWSSVRDFPAELRKRIASFNPTADAFYEFKESDGDLSSGPVECGFRKLALHQLSVSGFGAKSGGPLGGRNQTNAMYPASCRWNSQRLKESVTRLSRLLNGFQDLKITCGDFGELFIDAPRECFIYSDPPYVAKGPELYKHCMSEADHERLASIVRSASCEWAVSYDDHEDVRKLYSWARIEEVFVTYTNATNATGRRPKNREVVITNSREFAKTNF